MEKTLIEESTVELLELFDKVSEEAKKEKASKIILNRMVYYWTRKPLVVSRFITLASTLNNISTVKDLLNLRYDVRAYKIAPNSTDYKKKLGSTHSKIKILDPFGGGGNLIFEAKRLGLNCTCSDYNPVAYLLEKSVLEFPVKFGPKLATDFEKYSKQIVELTKKEVGKFYNSNNLTHFWFWCIKCPHCDQRVPLTNQMWIVNNSKKKIGVRFHTTPDKNFKTELVSNMKPEEGKKFTQKLGKAICISCKNSIDYDTLTNDIAIRRDCEMVLIQFQKSQGRDYKLAIKSDKTQFKDASDFLKSTYDEYLKLDLIPIENILPGHRKEHTLWHYGIKNWNEFFSDRQLLLLTTFLKHTRNVCNQIKDKEYGKALSVYLGFMLSKHIEMNCFGTVWHTRAEKPEHALSLKQPRIVYNYVEENPFEKIGGSFVNIINSIKNAILFCNDSNKCEVHLKSVTEYTNSVEKYDLIITDPPYLDDVQYGEMSEFFYVWLYRCIKEFYPELPNRIPLEEDFCMSWGRFGDKTLAYDFFENGFKKSMVSLNNTLKDDGLLIIFFAHSTTKAWNLLLESLRESKFYVVSSYAVHTEMQTAVMMEGKTAFKSSIIVACRKLKQQKSAYFEDVIPQTEDSIKSMIEKISIEKLLGLPITDLLIMVYGKVMEVCTQFTELKSYEKDFTPNFETLIEGAPNVIMKTIIKKLTDRSINTLGLLTSFYILTKIFYHGIMSSDDALKTARTYGISVDSLEKNNIGKKEGNTIRLFYLHENELDLNPEEIDRNNLHQQLCYLVQASKKEGASKIKSIIDKKEFRVDDLKQIILLLINSIRLRINKNEKINDAEKEELRLLESIADVMGIKTSTEKKGGMDEFL